MRMLKFLLQKEFSQIFRNRTILAIIFLIPVIQLLILPFAANYEIKNINIAIVDNDHSSFSQLLTSSITSSGYFRLIEYSTSYDNAYKHIETDEVDLILEIPAGFERNLIREGSQKIYIAMNAINGVKASIGGSYLTGIISSFNSDIILAMIPSADLADINAVPLIWYNSEYNYKLFLIPGILALLVTIIGGFLTALNIVKEKESGTIEQINVTPIKKWQFILGKLIPFWILAMIVFSIGLLLVYFIYGIGFRGSILLLYLFSGVYLLAVLGFGLLVSTFCRSQQQAMFIMFFFILIFLLLGGLFTPIESMPQWAQWLTKLNPVAYFIQVIRMVMLKGSGFMNILPQFSSVVLMAIVLNGWAVYNYRKTEVK